MVTAETEVTERVFLTLLGLADSTGYLGKFAREETLDYARVKPMEFERAVAELQADGRLRVNFNSGRRRFTVLNLARRKDALQYINGQRSRVQALNRERDRLNAVRTDGYADVILSDVVREVTRNEKVRWRFSVEVPEIGTIRDCSFYEQSRKLYGPSRFSGSESETLVEFKGHLQSQIIDAIRRHIDAATGA